MVLIYLKFYVFHHRSCFVVNGRNSCHPLAAMLMTARLMLQPALIKGRLTRLGKLSEYPQINFSQLGLELFFVFALPRLASKHPNAMLLEQKLYRTGAEEGQAFRVG